VEISTLFRVMDDAVKLLREFIDQVIQEKTDPALDDNVTQSLTSQQFDYRLHHGCPVHGSRGVDADLTKRKRFGQDENGDLEFAGNFYVCSKVPDPYHYNLSIPSPGRPARERYRGPKPETRDSIEGPKANDGKNRVIKGRLPSKKST
jgi:hypothetical protein